jgi:hypothetical protein
MGASIRIGADDLLRDLITARKLQPVLLETTKIVADIRARRVLGLAGAVRGMCLAVLNFLGKRKRHLSVSLSQFYVQTREHRARQPLRIALG